MAVFFLNKINSLVMLISKFVNLLTHDYVNCELQRKKEILVIYFTLSILKLIVSGRIFSWQQLGNKFLKTLIWHLIQISQLDVKSHQNRQLNTYLVQYLFRRKSILLWLDLSVSSYWPPWMLKANIRVVSWIFCVLPGTHTGIFKRRGGAED